MERLSYEAKETINGNYRNTQAIKSCVINT